MKCVAVSVFVVVCFGTIVQAALVHSKATGTAVDSASNKCNGASDGCMQQDNPLTADVHIPHTGSSWPSSPGDVTSHQARVTGRKLKSKIYNNRKWKHSRPEPLYDGYDDFGLDTPHSLGKVGRGQRLLLHKGAKLVIALILIKLKLIAAAIFLVLLGIKKLVLIVALLGPLAKKFKFNGRYVTDINFPPLTDDHVDHHDATWDHHRPPHWHPKHFDERESIGPWFMPFMPPFSPHDYMKENGVVDKGPLINMPNDLMKQNGPFDSYRPPSYPHDYVNHNGAVDYKGPPFLPYDLMKQTGPFDRYKHSFNPHHYTKENGAVDNKGPPMVMPYNHMKQNGAVDSERPLIIMPYEVIKQNNGPFARYGPPFNQHDYMKRNGALESSEPPFHPHDSMKQNGADYNNGHLHKTHYTIKQNGADDSGTTFNPFEYLKQHGEGDTFGTVYKPHDSIKQNGGDNSKPRLNPFHYLKQYDADDIFGPVHKPHKCVKKQNATDEYLGPVFKPNNSTNLYNTSQPPEKATVETYMDTPVASSRISHIVYPGYATLRKNV